MNCPPSASVKGGPVASNRCRRDIIEKTTGEIRTFLSALANGTSHYKSLHNLTEQIEHQYEGRFLIELLQNAHDVLFQDKVEGDEGRVEIVVVPDEAPFGALYVANDGEPFSLSNFLNLSNLGQSDKDPEKSIGNKGIGFRSVLEICREPEIYSRQDRTSSTFDGYCFRFTPSVIDLFKKAIHNLARDGTECSPIDSQTSLVLWGNTELEQFRQRYFSKDNEWLDGEMAFLSPYLLPIPVVSDGNHRRIADFGNRRFATVIRMPFLSEDKRDRAKILVENLDENTVLFLERIHLLYLDSGDTQNYVGRKGRRLKNHANGEQIDISIDSTEEGTATEKRYWLWQRAIGGDQKPEEADEVRNAVSKLPGKWPEVRKATVAIAVRVGETPETGYFNIYLPTKVQSGCCAHFNGPFYGTMDRTNIDLGKDYNKLLLGYIGRMAADVVIAGLTGKDIDEARAIIDILSPLEGRAGERWWSLLKAITDETGVVIDEESLILTDTGWKGLYESSLLPPVDKHNLITEEVLRQNATFAVINRGLLSREEQIEALFACNQIDSLPATDDLVNTVEKVAQRLHSQRKRADWNSFWYDAMHLLPKGSELRGKKVLLGTDGLLHASGEGTSVFFRPRAGGQDDEILPEEVIDGIPHNLRTYIAFLHESIQTHVPRKEGGYQLTAIQKYLASELVQSFSVEDIFREVLVSNTPTLPMPLKSRETDLCRDIIQWGFRLAAWLIARGKGESIIGLLGRLPVPCHGGWFSLSETSFGRGWGSAAGGSLEMYLNAANTKEAKDVHKRVVLPPHDRRWGGTRYLKKERLEQAGVFDGLRLRNLEPKEWKSVFSVGGWGKVLFPQTAPPCFGETFWGDYRQSVPVCEKPYYSGYFDHRVEPLTALPGLDAWNEIDLPIREAFAELVLKSGPKWEGSWRRATIKKTEGMAHYYTAESPLHYFLRNLPWIVSGSEDHGESFRPRDRWYVDHRTLAGRLHQFAHLMPLPSAIAAEADANPQLVSFLRELGMPVFDLEKQSNDRRLLTALADALKNPDSIADQNVFLGQVRDAWRVFRPAPTDPFPNQIIVREGPGKLALFPYKDNQFCYLPDMNLVDKEVFEDHSIPIVAIEVRDAQVLAGFFKKTYGNDVQLMSELTVRPLVEEEEWSEARGGIPLQSSHFRWIVPILLSVLANYGGLARGTQTKRFREIMDSTRNVRVGFARALERTVWRGGACILRATTNGYWLPESRTLLCTDDSRAHVSKLSEALSAILERPDLDTALRLVLGRLEREEAPDRGVIISALKEVHISESQYAEVEQLWLGNLAWTIRLLQPLLLLFNSGASLAGLSAVNSESDLAQCISTFNFGSLGSEACLSLVRVCHGYEELGNRLFSEVGEEAELGKWNQALSAAGEKIIRNSDAKSEFKSHIQSAAVPLRAVLRQYVRQEPEGTYLPDLWKELEFLPCPDEFEINFWAVPFGATIAEVSGRMNKWGVASHILEVVTKAGSCTVLTEALEEIGFEPTVDPLMIYTANREDCLKMLRKVQQVAVAWCLKTRIAPDGWDVPLDELFVEIEIHLRRIGYIDPLDDITCFNLIKSLSRKDLHGELWKRLDAAPDLDSFELNAGVSKDELSKADEGLQRYKEEAQRKKRMLSVCGKEFECTQENFSGVWDHVTGAVADMSLPTVELDRVTGLDEPPKKKPGPHGPGQPSKPQPRPPQAVKDLIGLVGEIHTYRSLLRQYGSTVINPSVWKSSNSRFKFPDNTADDSLGCDFLFHQAGREYHIEVKATQGEDESFELGATEIRHAVEVANKRNIRFMVFHVTDALTEKPGFRLLPNPYDNKYRQFYRIEEAGLRVRYKLAGPARL